MRLYLAELPVLQQLHRVLLVDDDVIFQRDLEALYYETVDRGKLLRASCEMYSFASKAGVVAPCVIQIGATRICLRILRHRRGFVPLLWRGIARNLRTGISDAICRFLPVGVCPSSCHSLSWIVPVPSAVRPHVVLPHLLFDCLDAFR